MTDLAAPGWTRPSSLFYIGAMDRLIAGVTRLSYVVSFLVTLAVCPAVSWAAPPSCAPDIVGSWTGQVADAGRIKELATRFSTGSNQLTGTYHVEDEDGGYDGTLTDFVETGPCEGHFLWHDRNGTGGVWVNFRPGYDRFDGLWGIDAPLKDHIFTGRRYRPVPVS
jgi:hypothetical protein